MTETKRQDLAAIFKAGVAACLPGRVLPRHLPRPPAGRTILLALGKAAVPMARVVVENWEGELTGLAVAPHGAAAGLERIAVTTAGHPVPDGASVDAASRLMALAEGAGADDLVLVLLSGGASALACLPGKGLSLEEKRTLTTALLRSGAAIGEINCVRRHVSLFKGGRLGAAAAPARLVTLAISDAPAAGDIGSGPTLPDPSLVNDARAILRRYGIMDPAAGWSETPKTAPPGATFTIVASEGDAIEAAAEKAGALGYAPLILGRCYEDAAALARRHAAMIREGVAHRTALISGGELTVRVGGGGRGGPNQEYALALAIALQGAPNVWALAADTDGIDGIGDAAGAFIGPASLDRARALGLDPERALRDSDSGAFFAALADLFVTGPTGTNVNDLRVILIDP
jgi:hydroxypyruvate reductase